VLRFVDAWACREGTPEDEKDRRIQMSQAEGESVWSLESMAGVEMQTLQSTSSKVEAPLREAAAGEDSADGGII